MAPMMFVTTAIEPATLLVSAQIRPMIVPTTSTATTTASQYKIRRLVMALSVLLSRQNLRASKPRPARRAESCVRIEERELEAGGQSTSARAF